MIDLKKKSVSDDELETALLQKFVIKGAWHEYHIYESDIPKSFPSHLRNRIMKIARKLRSEGLLISFPHGREHVFVLNKDKSEEILQRTKKYLE